MTQFEYNMIVEDMYLPLLRGVLPARPVTAGEEWAIADAAGMMLCGEIDPPDLAEKPSAAESKKTAESKRTARPGSRGDREDSSGVPSQKNADRPQLPPQADRRPTGSFVGKFIRLEPGKGKPTAYFEVNGRIDMGAGEHTDILARLTFECTPQPVSKPGETDAGRSNAVIKCPGAITEIRLSKRRTLPIADTRLRRFLTWDYILERRLGDPNISLDPRDAPPKPNEENSWIRLSDARDQFKLEHSQRFQLSTIDPEHQSLSLFHYPIVGTQRGLVPDSLLVKLSHDAVRPEDFKDQLDRTWQSQFHWQVNAGPIERLPDIDWQGRQAYRFEAILRPTAQGPLVGGPKQLFHIAYVVQYAQVATLLVEVVSPNNSLPSLRSEVEAMLRTVELGPKWNNAEAGSRRPAARPNTTKSTPNDSRKSPGPRNKPAPPRTAPPPR